MRDIEIKTFPLRLDEKGVGEDGSFRGYAATYGVVDRTGDVIEPGAFKRSLDHNPRVPILHVHDPLEPIGVAELAEDGKGLRFEGKLELEVQRAREDHALMRSGAMRRMSIGYKAVQRDFSQEDGRFVRHLREVAVKEVSPVPTGLEANPLAVIENVKSVLDLDEDELMRAIREAQRTGRALDLDHAYKISSAIDALTALLPDDFAGLADDDHGSGDPTRASIEETLALKTELSELAEAIRSR